MTVARGFTSFQRSQTNGGRAEDKASGVRQENACPIRRYQSGYPTTRFHLDVMKMEWL